jgi:chromosome partitioning protein
MKTIAVINQKGGVGKTACAYNLAFNFSLRKPTLLIDLDPSGNATKGLFNHIESMNIATVKEVLTVKDYNPFFSVYPSIIGGREITQLFVMPSKIDLALAQRELMNRPYRETILKKQIERLGERQEYIFIDCSPTLSELTINAIYAADFILIPVSYEEDALEGMSDLFKVIYEIREDGIEFKILRNQKDSRKTKTNAYIEDKLHHFIASDHVLKTIIRQDEHINQAKIERRPVFMYDPSCNGACDFNVLTEELLTCLND